MKQGRGGGVDRRGEPTRAVVLAPDIAKRDNDADRAGLPVRTAGERLAEAAGIDRPLQLTTHEATALIVNGGLTTAHLGTLALTGADPVAVLRTTVGARELEAVRVYSSMYHTSEMDGFFFLRAYIRVSGK